MASRIPKPLIVLLVISLLLAVGFYVRRTLGIEMSPEALRDWVADSGAIAPIVAIFLIAFRPLIGIPSHFILVAVGLCFGTALGTLYGAIGLLVTAAIVFLLARHGGRDYVAKRMPERYFTMMENAGSRGGVAVVGLITAYPLGPLTPVHLIAGVTSMAFPSFLAAVFIGALLRAACYAYFGSALIEGGIQPVLTATAVLLALLCLPLLFPKSRELLKQWMAVK